MLSLHIPFHAWNIKCLGICSRRGAARYQLTLAYHYYACLVYAYSLIIIFNHHHHANLCRYVAWLLPSKVIKCSWRKLKDQYAYKN